MRLKADHDGGLNGCKNGELFLNGSSIQFTCPSNRAKDVLLNADEIKGIHNNGVEAVTGHKYHFDVEGRTAAETERLFQEWLSQAKTPTYPAAN